jgi:hypothetical protein
MKAAKPTQHEPTVRIVDFWGVAGGRQLLYVSIVIVLETTFAPACQRGGSYLDHAATSKPTTIAASLIFMRLYSRPIAHRAILDRGKHERRSVVQITKLRQVLASP